MRVLFFCQNPYAFGILAPLKKEAVKRNFEIFWFLKADLIHQFPFLEDNYTNLINEIIAYKPDVVFVPGNEVPYYIRGLKTQVFHGLAGEKKGHFRIRHYFDLYLTQGPYFTKKFKELSLKHQDFEVIETGWPKLDVYGTDKEKYMLEKQRLLTLKKAEHLVLYAPTFSPSLTSAPYLINEIRELASSSSYYIQFKFHDLMDSGLVDSYRKLAEEFDNVDYVEDKNITKYLLMADVMISDTSSVVYEFLLLNKPVITFKSIAEHIRWENLVTYENLSLTVVENLTEDNYKIERESVIKEYHPYNDGLSASRMFDAVSKYIEKYGVPSKRNLSFWRKRKIHKMFGKF